MFSRGRVRSVTLSGTRSAAPETGPRAPWPPALSFAHMCTLPPHDQGRRRPVDKGTGFRPWLEENWCPLPVWFLQYVLLRITRSKQSSTAAFWKLPDHKHALRRRNDPPATLYYSKLYILMRHKTEQGSQNTGIEKQKQHRQYVCVCGCKVYFHPGMTVGTTE